MEWLELTIDAPAGELERLCSQLEDLGVTGLVIEDEADFLAFLEEHRQYWDYVDDALAASMRGRSRVRFYLEDTAAGHAQIRRMERSGLPPLSARTIREEDWANNWKAYYRPIPVGERFLIVPQWEQVDAGGRIPLRLDPGLIFGTGDHPTTQLCLEAIERLVRPGQQVLDLGCGSGILGIGALLLGAGHVLGCDIDPKAPDIVAENAALNGLGTGEIGAVCGDVCAPGPLRQRLGAGRYDLILANIVADVLIALAPFTAPWLAPGGTMVCSGILDGREAEVEAALLAGGFSVTERHKSGDWHSIICQNQRDS